MSSSPIAHTPHYLVCVDQRTESHVALKLAAAKAGARGGVINLIHVLPPTDFQTLHAVADRMRAEQRAEAESFMQQLAADIQQMSGITPALIMREGQIGEEIIAAVAEVPEATMLVLGVSENSPSRGKLTGWLASQLGTGLFIPLLLVPGNLTDQQLEALI